MSYRVRRPGRKPSKTKASGKRSLQKPNGVIRPRVQKVGGEHFAIVCGSRPDILRRYEIPERG